MKKHGVTLDCQHCRWLCSESGGAFDVTVPLSEDATGMAGTARLHCVVSADRHRVELVEWADTGTGSGENLEGARQRIATALAFVAEQRICGNRRLCPVAVTCVVEACGDDAEKPGPNVHAALTRHP